MNSQNSAFHNNHVFLNQCSATTYVSKALETVGSDYSVRTSFYRGHNIYSGFFTQKYASIFATSNNSNQSASPSNLVQALFFHLSFLRSTSCVQAAKAWIKLRGCTPWSEPLLFACAFSTFFACYCLYFFMINQKYRIRPIYRTVCLVFSKLQEKSDMKNLSKKRTPGSKK